MDNEIIQEASNISAYIPYIFSALSAIVSGLASYFLAIRQARIEIQRLEKQHELDLDTEREKHQMELQKMELEHKHQMESKEKDFTNGIGETLTTTLFTELMKTPEMQEQITQEMKKRKRKVRR